MIQDAEEYSEEDGILKERVDARNSLESYLYNMKTMLDDEESGMSSRISEPEKEVTDSQKRELDDNHFRNTSLLWKLHLHSNLGR